MIFTRKLLWTQHSTSSADSEETAVEETKTMHEKRELQNVNYLEELFERYPVLEPVRKEIFEAYEALKECFASDHKLLVAGNGGSAADSEHIVGELMKGFKKQRKLPEDMAKKLCQTDLQAGEELAEKLQGSLRSIALTGHPGLATAFLNDIDGQLIYAQQVYGYGVEGDVFLAISTSGNSSNIHYACVTARARGLKVIGLTGKDGGMLKHDADVAIVVPEMETFKIQELHLPIYHALCLMLEEYFF